ncbi:MAG: Trk system potassium transporter TrkA [Lachnospiraceae bacterium]|jgi:trk system potassium uptake protein TrkA|nr:Trk system potassium transporter TrkA [Lachnospiraceae bacterium]
MQIIIVGCGKVGATLVQRLSIEKHDIVVIDTKEEKVHTITDESDAKGIVGNGVSYQTLQEADITHTDLLIAVTGSDEQNLLCCVIAKKAGNCKTIASVRNPNYNKEIAFLRKELGLAMIINPDLISAAEIARIFQFPFAIKADPFAKGRIELLHFRIPKDSRLDQYKILNIRSTLRCDILICMVRRNEEIVIPNGDFVLRAGDIISVAASPAKATDFFQKIGINTGRIHSAMLVGGGKISYYLAKRLLASGIETKIVERDMDRCQDLSEALPKAIIIHGDATDQKLLIEESLEQVEGFAALTGVDEENILLSLFAKKVSSAKVVTKVNRINFKSVLTDLNLDSITYPRLLTADYISKYARSMNASLNSNVENLYKLEETGRAEALEFLIKEDSEVTGIPLSKLRIRKNILVCCIIRDGNVIIPGGHDVISPGDSVVIVLTDMQLKDIKEILE